MSTQTNSANPPKKCQFCKRKGLPILPLRYAVARKDKGNAPQLSSPFEIGSKEKNKADLALPGDMAHYTLRLLRPGYLYVHDDHRKEWTAYQVAQGGYLFEFDPHAKAPPGGWAKVDFTCENAADAMVARCIMVKDADSATTIWLGFSDVVWTADVLKKHGDPAYRAAHMRRIDVSSVKKGSQQPHATGLDKLASHVAEYATTPAALNAETTTYVKKFLPSPYTRPSDLLASNESAKLALKMCSKLILDLIPVTQGNPKQQGRTPSAAWVFSADALYADGVSALAMQAWAAASAKPFHAGMVALDDPAGVAMEINGLALQLSAEFCEEPSRKWRHETALTIAAIKEAVMHGAVEKEKGWRKGLSDFVMRYAETGGGPYASAGMQMARGPDGKSAYDKLEEGRLEEDAKIDEEVEANAETIGEDEWKKHYATLFNEDAQLSEISPTGSYATDLQKFAEQHIKPLDGPFLGWLKSTGFTRYFTHNFDTKDLDSGLSYTGVLTTVLNQVGGRTAVVDYLTKAIQQDPTSPEALIARGFALNQDELAKKWVEKAAEKAGESEAGKALAEISEKVYDGYKGLILAGNSGVAFNGIAKYTYQLSASFVNALGAEVTAAGANVAKSLPTRMLYGLLGAVAREEDPNLIMLDLSTSANTKQAAKIVGRALGTILGGGHNQYMSAAGKALNEKPGSFRGIVLIDKEKAEGLLRAKKGKTLSAAEISLVVEPQAFDDAVDGMAAKILNGEVKGGVVGSILTAITCAFAYKEYAEAKGDAKVKQGINFFVGSLSSLVGGTMEVAGNVVEKTAWGASKLTAPFKIVSVEFGSRAQWLTGTGKMLGVVGGVVAGVITIVDGVGEWHEGHHALSLAHLVLGGLAIASALLLLTTLAVWGFVIGVIVGLILLAIAIFKHNKVQDWLENAKYFGDGKLKPFKNSVEQMQALAALGGG